MIVMLDIPRPQRMSDDLEPFEELGPGSAGPSSLAVQESLRFQAVPRDHIVDANLAE